MSSLGRCRPCGEEALADVALRTRNLHPGRAVSWHRLLRDCARWSSGVVQHQQSSEPPCASALRTVREELIGMAARAQATLLDMLNASAEQLQAHSRWQVELHTFALIGGERTRVEGNAMRHLCGHIRADGVAAGPYRRSQASDHVGRNAAQVAAHRGDGVGHHSGRDPAPAGVRQRTHVSSSIVQKNGHTVCKAQE